MTFQPIHAQFGILNNLRLRDVPEVRRLASRSKYHTHRMKTVPARLSFVVCRFSQKSYRQLGLLNRRWLYSQYSIQASCLDWFPKWLPLPNWFHV